MLPMSHPDTFCAHCRMSSTTIWHTSSAATSRPASSLTSSSPALMGSRVRQTHLPLCSWSSSIRCWCPKKLLLLPPGSPQGRQAPLGEAAGVRAGAVLAWGSAPLCATARQLCRRLAITAAGWHAAKGGWVRTVLLLHVHACMTSAACATPLRCSARAIWVVLCCGLHPWSCPAAQADLTGHLALPSQDCPAAAPAHSHHGDAPGQVPAGAVRQRRP